MRILGVLGGIAFAVWSAIVALVLFALGGYGTAEPCGTDCDEQAMVVRLFFASSGGALAGMMIMLFGLVFDRRRVAVAGLVIHAVALLPVAARLLDLSGPTESDEWFLAGFAALAAGGLAIWALTERRASGLPPSS